MMPRQDDLLLLSRPIYGHSHAATGVDASVADDPAHIMGELSIPLRGQFQRLPGGLVARDELCLDRYVGIGHRTGSVPDRPDDPVLAGQVTGRNPATVRGPDAVVRCAAQARAVGEPEFDDLVAPGDHVPG